MTEGIIIAIIGAIALIVSPFAIEAAKKIWAKKPTQKKTIAVQKAESNKPTFNLSPDFSEYIFDNSSSCWEHIKTNQYICPVCKVSGTISPVAENELGWRCPVHDKYVGYKPQKPTPFVNNGVF